MYLLSCLELLAFQSCLKKHLASPSGPVCPLEQFPNLIISDFHLEPIWEGRQAAESNDDYASVHVQNAISFALHCNQSSGNEGL